ncbi:GntR family transcriptional regulator [Salibacterium halotolerans]|uniref:DNA-binding transcriptional regulator YhcF, GntR family n=1 Tax=Salibacterium halotolerans TaxID=1884432 RepID=A0A1I5S296_9BACI|nr:GntR family transcriptional regulator [Salibacterium halotolerans]SFP64820.1 DNA-binding transcriptional regulator YhcF, GntR family [Salibacterium halotolerans]
MSQEFESNTPIYMQLADRINRRILRGELQPGEKLPSVRETSVQSNVNPNTVQRTYQILEQSGIAESRRGQGTFVTEDPAILQSMRERLKREEIASFVRVMKDMGYEAQEIQHGIQEFLEEENES